MTRNPTYEIHDLTTLFRWLIHEPAAFKERMEAAKREGAEHEKGIGMLFKNEDYVINVAAIAATMVGCWYLVMRETAPKFRKA